MDDWWAVRHDIPMLCDDGAQVWSTWQYSVHEPWSVFVYFDQAGVQWGFARDLLAVPRNGVAGALDVQVWNLGSRMSLRLRNGTDELWLKARAAKVRRFLTATYSYVPAGDEPTYVDVDAVVARILEEAERC